MLDKGGGAHTNLRYQFVRVENLNIRILTYQFRQPESFNIRIGTYEPQDMRTFSTEMKQNAQIFSARAFGAREIRVIMLAGGRAKMYHF